MKHQHIVLTPLELASAHLIDARIGLRGALDSAESLPQIELARVPPALLDALVIVDTCLRQMMDVDTAAAREATQAAQRVIAARAIA
jgi:hypothetical protein